MFPIGIGRSLECNMTIFELRLAGRHSFLEQKMLAEIWRHVQLEKIWYTDSGVDCGIVDSTASSQDLLNRNCNACYDD